MTSILCNLFSLNNENFIPTRSNEVQFVTFLAHEWMKWKYSHVLIDISSISYALSYAHTYTYTYICTIFSRNFATFTVCAISLFYIYTETSICFGFALTLHELLTGWSLYLILVLPLKSCSPCMLGRKIFAFNVYVFTFIKLGNLKSSALLGKFALIFAFYFNLKLAINWFEIVIMSIVLGSGQVY